jgi:hypothetical protein
MSTSNTEDSPRIVARAAGLLYLLWFPLGIFGILYVPEVLIEPGNMAATAENIAANELLFRLSIVTALVIGIIGIFLVFLLYRLLKPVNSDAAGLMVVFLLVSIPIAFLNELNKFAVLLLLDGEFSTIFTAEQANNLAHLFLDLHGSGIAIAGVFWGLWLLPMGYLVYSSDYLPRLIGVLLVIAGIGYLLDSLVFFVAPDIGIEFAMFMFWGEVIFPLWLVIKGVNATKWQERSKKSEGITESSPDLE